MQTQKKIYNKVFMIGTLTDFNKEVKMSDMGNGMGWTGKSFELGLNAMVGGQKNTQGLKFFGGLNDFNVKDGFPLEWKDKKVVKSVAYADRHDATILADVPFSKKKIFKNGDILKEFLCEKEFVEYIYANFKALVGKKVSIQGEMEHSMSKGKVYKKTIVSRVEVLPEGDLTPDKVDGQIQYYYTSDSITQEIFKSPTTLDLGLIQELIGEDKKLHINVYTMTNNQDKVTKKDTPKFLIPVPVSINLSKFDWVNDAILGADGKPQLNSLGVQISAKNVLLAALNAFRCPDASAVYTIGYNVRYFSGYETREIDEATALTLCSEEEIAELTIRESIEPGFRQKFLERKASEGKGDRISETNLIFPHQDTITKSLADDITLESLDLYKSLIVDKPKAENKPQGTQSTPTPSVTPGVAEPMNFNNFF